MAQIDLSNVKKIEKEHNTIHEKVHMTYTIFKKNDKKYIQFDTYGRENRKNPEKISQSFQLDKEAAEYLIQLINKEFNIK